MTYEISYQIDWLRWTCKGTDAMRRIIPALPCFKVKEAEIKALPWYGSAAKLAAGRMDWHEEKPEQGVMVTLTGKDLETLRETGVDIQTVLHHIEASGSSLTRMDFAIDLHNSGIKPDDFMDAMTAGTFSPASKKTLRWASADRGENTGVTVQFGSRQSLRCLRIYDKGAERKSKRDWLRLEIELHGGVARAVLKQMIVWGFVAAGKAAIQHFVKGSTMEILKDILGDKPEGLEIDPVGRKDTDWELWVLKTALPAVERALELRMPGVRSRLEMKLYGVVHRGEERHLNRTIGERKAD